MRYIVMACCAAALLPSSAGAQTSDGASTAPATTAAAPAVPATIEPAFANLSGFANDYQVGAGDLLEITVIRHPELNDTLRVSNSGEISHPRLGLLRVVDLDVFDIEVLIGDRLREKGLLQQPEVLVSVREFQAKPIYVSGAVLTPGEFIMSQELTVGDAILLAGGMQFNAADEALLHRRGAGGEQWSPDVVAADPTVARPGIEVINVDIRPLKEGRYHEVTQPLRRGDVLVVPQQALNTFFVVGEVVTPRNFSYAPGREVMVSQAISWAGGPMPTASIGDAMLVRVDEQGQRTELKIDYPAILRGKADDIPMQPNDIIFVPGSKVKTIGQGLLMLTDTMVMTTSFRIARTYQMPDAPEMVRPGQTATQP